MQRLLNDESDGAGRRLAEAGPPEKSRVCFTFEMTGKSLKRGFEGIRTVMHSLVQSGMVDGSIGNNVNKFNLLGGITWLRTKASKLLIAPIL